MTPRSYHPLQQATAALAAIVATTAMIRVAPAQFTAGGLADVPAQQVSPASVERARGAFDQASRRLATVRQQIERADRQNQPAAREQALATYRGILEELRPVTARMATAASLDRTPAARKMLDEYAGWQNEYGSLAGVGNVGAFQIEIGRRWTELTRNSADWMSENEPVTWQRLNETPEEPANQKLGLPKTVDFAAAVTSYIQDVRGMDAYLSFADVPEVRNDLAQAAKARQEAYEKLADAAEGVIADAEADTLDQAKRDRLDAFVEQDLRKALAGYAGTTEILTRGRAAVNQFDRQATGTERANAMLRERLIATADEQWPTIRDRYNAEKMPMPTLAQRGEVVTFENVKNELGRTFRSNDYDLAFEMNGYPIVARFAPALKEQYKATMSSIDLAAPAEEARYDFVAVVAGLGRIEQERPVSSPGVRQTTQTSADNPEAQIEVATRPTRLVVSDAVIVDVVALHVGPVAVGVDVPVPAPQPARR